ncbi:MAG: TrkH family potassium uptake protein [bacterium]
MDFKAVLHVLGALLVFVGLTLLLPMGFALYYNEGDFFALLWSLLITIAIGVLLWKLTPAKPELKIREGFAVVTFGWILLAGFATLPFLLSDVKISFTDAFFETMSGFTTTGATILTDVEALPHGLLFWRSLTHWLGGMGIIVLSLAILPMLGVGGMQLFKAEVPGPQVDKLRPRVQDTAKILWGVYVLFSVIELVLLKVGGMTLFDAACHTFGTMATGGFSTKNAGIGYYQSTYIEYVITFFMIIAGTNFALHYRAIKGQFRSYFHSSEFRFYLGVIGLATILVFLDLRYVHHFSPSSSFEKSIFQVTSLMTTTGYHSADYETWSVSSQLILIVLMFIGGCAGSTGGSIKVIRIYLTVKYSLVQLKKLLHPNAVIPIRMSNRSIPPQAITDILGFLLLYITIFVLASIFMSFLGLDIITSVSTVVSTLGNIGPGIETIGPTENFAHIPTLGKWVLSFLMLTGRLEIYTVLVIFNRNFWKK